MNHLAKQLYNIAPDDVTLTFTDGTSVDLSIHQAEFFQDELEAEGDAEDGTTHRIVDGDDETLLVARESNGDWAVVGNADAVARADADSNDADATDG